MVLFFAPSAAYSIFVLVIATPCIGSQVTGPNSISTCRTISKNVSKSSGVYYPGHRLYRKGNRHWASSSSQASACVVEPGSAEDVSVIMKIVGSTSTPFGIRSGGHTSNPGFSSTSGVQISLLRLTQLVYRPAVAAPDGSIGIVDIGPGHVWDTVYGILQKYNATVVGSRATGVGIGGFILGGGGYSWLSSQYGLTIDTMTAFQVVLPNGTIATATESKNSDLFFGLKGGFNNFGVVTRFTMRAFPQRKVWGGLQLFGPRRVSRIADATADFLAKSRDPKAAIIVEFNFFFGLPSVVLRMFYDGPKPPKGTFEQFASIPHLTSDVRTRSMRSLLRSSPSNLTSGFRGTFNTVSLKKLSPGLLKQIKNQTIYWGRKGINRGGLISYHLASLQPSITARNKGGAYPHDTFITPIFLYVGWHGKRHDNYFVNTLKESSTVIFNQAVAEGQYAGGSLPVKYGNYGTAKENLESIYGKNLPLLRQIKQRYDPRNVMSLTGGYRL